MAFCGERQNLQRHAEVSLGQPPIRREGDLSQSPPILFAKKWAFFREGHSFLMSNERTEQGFAIRRTRTPAAQLDAAGSLDWEAALPDLRRGGGLYRCCGNSTGGGRRNALGENAIASLLMLWNGQSRGLECILGFCFWFSPPYLYCITCHGPCRPCLP